MRNSQQYVDRLREMRPNVYTGGKTVRRDDPRIMPGVKVISKTFDLVDDPEFADLLTATSHLSGQRISRFSHIHHSVDDLRKKQEMTRKICQRTGGCVQRCMGVDALNAISVVAYDIDQATGSEYYPRFLKYLRYFQDNDLVGNAAQSDAKGNRKLRPHQQADPDLYLRVVERRKNGIIVRGCKAHNSTSPYADEIIVLPTRAMTKEEGDWAVAFATPADAEGISLITRTSSYRPRKYLEAPLAEIGESDSFTVFEDVFVPWERVFLCGEWQAAGQLALQFANFHRFSYTGCKPAITDILMGAAALVAEYNGIEDASHVKDEITELIAIGELVYATGVAAAHCSKVAASGTYVPEALYSNIGRYHAGTNIFKEYETLVALAGGLPGTLPPEEDFYDEHTGPLLAKYIMRKEGINAENQHRCFRLISDLVCSGQAGLNQIGGIHGGGSPVMERIGIRAGYDLETRKKLAKYLAGIQGED